MAPVLERPTPRRENSPRAALDAPAAQRPGNGARPPLEILMVVQRLPHVAGAETQALGLAAAFVARGHNVRFLSTRHADGLARRDVVRDLPVTRVSVARGPLLKPSQLAGVGLEVARRGGSFDVVHAHCVSASALGAILGARAASVPVLVKPSLGGPDGELAKLADSAAAPLLLPILRRATRFAALNGEIADELVDLGVERTRVELVDNGVDLDLFAPPSAAERDAARARYGLGDAPVALFIGQLQDRKGILETLEAWRAVRRAIPDALLLVAGAGAREREVRRAADDPSRGVRYLSVLDDVVSVLRAADVFVMPSRNESFGNATVEAMACGLPVVVCRVGVARRVGIDGVAGEVLDAPEPEAIARSLVDLLAAPHRARSLGERAAALAAEFAYERVAERYLAIYESMLAARAS